MDMNISFRWTFFEQGKKHNKHCVCLTDCCSILFSWLDTWTDFLRYMVLWFH